MKRIASVLMVLCLLAPSATADEPAGIPALYAKEIAGNRLKIYAKDIVGVGKVQFLFNGEEVAWVRARDGSDPKLRRLGDTVYLVRTVVLKPGLNQVKILVNSDTAWSRDYRK